MAQVSPTTPVLPVVASRIAAFALALAAFPTRTSAFAYANDLQPALADKLKRCFIDYRFSAEMKKAFLGDDCFLPVSYKNDWGLVRKVAEASGTPFNKAAFDREAAAEAKGK
jgi:phosphonate transport system substrate-binding protein